MSESPDLREATQRLAARSRELDVLQSMGRRAAEAYGPQELFDSVLAVLSRAQELDLALVCYEWDGAPTADLFLARPFSAVYLEAVEQRASRFLGWPEGVEPRSHALAGFDTARGERVDFREQDLLLLPLIRRGQPPACLLVVSAGEPEESQLRLLYSASNQLSLHLERILTVREAEADRFRAIVDAMPQGVLLTDRELRILQANRPALRMLDSCGLAGSGSLAGELERLGIATFVDRVCSGAADVAEGETRVGSNQTWSVTVSPVPGEGSGVAGLGLVLTDVTESRRLQQQLSHSEKMSSLGQMISGVAHELNNPLASILGYAQLLQGSAPEDAKLRKRLEVLSREAERCRKIVGNLLSFARRREPERKRLSLNQVVENVSSLLRYQLRVEDVRLEHDLSPNLPAMEGDAHQLEQVLVNLLTNAGHAVRQTRAPGVVTLRTRTDGNRATILEISDTGPGIPGALRSKIFDPFFTTKAPGDGTGLGLSLAYGIVTAHGGTIEVADHQGPGTTFRITFPPGESTARKEPAAALPGPVAPPAGGRILVVDDDEAVGLLICEALCKDGYMTEQACGGRQALEQLAAENFDLVICDLKMPDVSGERLYEELKRVRPGLERRILWTTGDTLSTDADELVARTGLELLTKPFDLDELRRHVRRRLEG